MVYPYIIRVQALHSEQQQVLIPGVQRGREVTMVAVILGVETLSPSPQFLILGVGLEHMVSHRAEPVLLPFTRDPLLKQIPGEVEGSLLVLVGCTLT